ncbi:rhodanese-related sulfurtransferase [Melghiribacillus thermohalophilus]|uniref:Rhodanese-related sulfurtransferase n=1 Tax=Melghiribacillus thermohalophilus TaxID=1324956 RepID=A0A4R3MWW6_9BACI|nr:rhodanese-like domain-containing protein [Melghiribacillus thermohalophilus]TCT20016.1 rhodanese-related sulfurtransferase [Melghiribacillus thermohalophilus]
MDTITAKEVEEMINSGKEVHIIDVREAAEVQQGAIPGAVNIPLSLLEFRAHELDKNKEYVMVCRSGNRSGLATQYLNAQGYHAVNMVGGMIDWEGPVE